MRISAAFFSIFCFYLMGSAGAAVSSGTVDSSRSCLFGFSLQKAPKALVRGTQANSGSSDFFAWPFVASENFEIRQNAFQFEYQDLDFHSDLARKFSIRTGLSPPRSFV